MAVTGFSASVGQHESGGSGFLKNRNIHTKMDIVPLKCVVYMGNTDAHLLNS